MNQKLFLSALAAAVAAPAVIAPIQAEAATAFSDIGKLDKVTQDKIQTLVSKGIINGFTDGTFRPADYVTRGQFALFISKALELPAPKKPASFKDVTPKVSTYDGIVRAYEAGIIKGYTADRFSPQETITRSQMAIMLDKALQYKASYPAKAQLTYTDKGSIGASSQEAVQRMTHYGIMGGYNGGKAFAPTSKGDRLMTVLSIHELMQVKGLLLTTPSDPNPEITPPSKPGDVPFKADARDYTLAELRQLLPATTRIERSNNDGSVVVTDMVEEYYNTVHLPYFVGYKTQPLDYFKTELSLLSNVHKKYDYAFPKYELISINNIPYRYSEYYPEFLKKPATFKDHELNSLVAAPPTVSGKFLIDIGTLNKDVVTYMDKEIKLERTTIQPIMTTQKDFLVDVASVFNDTDLVQVSKDGKTITYAGNTLTLAEGTNKALLNNREVVLTSKVVKKDNLILAPVLSIANYLNLSGRKLDMYNDYAKVELANYPLPVETVNSDNDLVSMEGLGWER